MSHSWLHAESESNPFCYRTGRISTARTLVPPSESNQPSNMSNKTTSQAKLNKQLDWSQLSYEQQKELAKASPTLYTMNCFDMPRPRPDKYMLLR